MYDDTTVRKCDIVYARVSSHDQKLHGDLDRQALFLVENVTDMLNPIILKEVGSGLNDNRKQLQKLLQLVCEGEVTTKVAGTVGLDYNAGFIELSETDARGNLVYQRHVPLKYHGTGNKAKSEIELAVAQITNYAKTVGKDLVIEDLSFKRTKARTDKYNKRNKRNGYNKMIHLFDYSRFVSTVENACHRNSVALIVINPYMTSQIGRQKYCDKKKLNVHQAASYVIARKGQGFVDSYVNN